MSYIGDVVKIISFMCWIYKVTLASGYGLIMTGLLLKKEKKKEEGYDRTLIEIVREAQLKNDLSFIFI